jgi:heat shock protein HtpX
MAGNPTLILPPRRSLAVWILLAIVLTLGFYLLTLVLAAACIYLPYVLLTHFGFGLQSILLMAAGLVMAATMLWSLLPRQEKFRPPGPLLDPASHPKLLSQLENISSSLNETMPSEIYLLADVNAFVGERQGARRDRLRIMGLGLSLLQVLTVSQLRAILTHEFGHYYGGDTRLGPWVYNSRAVMVRTLKGLGSPPAALEALGRFAVVALAYKLIIGVLVTYWKAFLQATLWASRRQEYRADELACRLAGSQALIDGLRSIRGAAAVSQAYWKMQVAPVLETGFRPPIGEGLATFLATPEVASSIDRGLEKELREAKTNAYDTHPALRDRIAAAERLAWEGSLHDNSPAISLLENIPALEAKLLQFLNPKFKIADLKPASWDQTIPDVFIPSWRRTVTMHASLLAGITTETLPDAAGRLRQMGSKIPDPKGMLLTPQQRSARAASLLGTALAIALVDQGWKPELKLGNLSLHCGEQKLVPATVVADLASGKVSREAWVEQLRSAGLEGLRLDKSSPTSEGQTGTPA